MTQAVSFEERPGSRRSTSSPPTHERVYVSAGIFDAAIVKASAHNLTPPVVAVIEGILFRNDIDVREQGYGIYYITVTYGERKRETGEYRFSFSTTGGTFHITHSRETVNSYGDDPPSMGQAINVRRNGTGPPDVEGTDVIIPALKLTYTFKHPAGTVNETFARNIARVTGTSNTDIWRGFDPGELLFLGADGADGSETEAEVSYQFAAEENLTGLIIAGIESIAKDGHDYLWVYWADDEAVDGQATKAPQAVYVERLYRRIPYGVTFGF
jgi:hypothetical protein